MNNKQKTYARINQMLVSFKNNRDKIVRLENKIDLIKDDEQKFQARLAVLDFYQDNN